jgi:hypothetical protein
MAELRSVKVSEQAKLISERNQKIRELIKVSGNTEVARKHVASLLGMIPEDIERILEAK